jgi:hypothetical protein
VEVEPSGAISLSFVEHMAVFGKLPVRCEKHAATLLADDPPGIGPLDAVLFARVTEKPSCCNTRS